MTGPRKGTWAHEIEDRLAKLEKWTHEPFDFTDLVRRLERLEGRTGETPSTQTQDMVAVGESLMQAIEAIRPKGSPYEHWMPADSPAEIVTDLVNDNDDLRKALKTAVRHLDHMAAVITVQKTRYSFEALGEDMPDIRALLAVSPPSKSHVERSEAQDLEHQK